MVTDIDINTAYAIYCLLDEQQRYEIDFCVQYSNLEEKDYFCDIELKDRSFSFVKELMAAFIEENFEEMTALIFSLPEYNEKKIMQSPAWKVIATMHFLVNEVKKLIMIENEMLTPIVQDNIYKNFIEQVDFSAFTSEYTQVRELAHEDITKFDEVRKLPYQTCLLELIYLQKKDDLEKLIMKSHKK